MRHIQQQNLKSCNVKELEMAVSLCSSKVYQLIIVIIILLVSITEISVDTVILTWFCIELSGNWSGITLETVIECPIRGIGDPTGTD